jgi:Bacteriophage Sf6, terminase small subunit-like
VRSKLNKETQERICQGIELGMTLDHAARFGMVDYSTMRRWIEKGEGEKPSKKHREFCEAYKRAQGKVEARCLAHIAQAAKGVFVDKVTTRTDSDTGEQVTESTKVCVQAPNWTAAAWVLERRWPAHYGRAPMVQQNISAQGEEVSVNVQGMSDREIESSLAELGYKKG